MFSDKLERTSFFIPDYMSDLLEVISLREGHGKSAFIREAILKQIARYGAVLDGLPDNHEGPTLYGDDFFGKALGKEDSRARKQSLFYRLMASTAIPT